MSENLGDRITIDDMARTAMFSKFHFSRIFQRVTGISPGRFLSALRLQEAKRLLIATPMTVADISHMVGYNSIGTFSSRFRSSVGMSPTEYRQVGGFPTPLPAAGPSATDGVAVRGQVWGPPACRPARTVIGLFGDRIAQGCPVRHTTIDGVGSYTLDGVPDGTWYLLAHSAELTDGTEIYLAALGPVEVRAGAPVRQADLWLRPRSPFDPPVLLAQLDEPMWAIQAWAPGRAEDAALPGA
ncbi:helix-turn-helix domain-containing protein [Actinophytocola sediminis]